MARIDLDAETSSQDPAIALAKLAERQQHMAEQSQERHAALQATLQDLKALIADLTSQVVQLRQSHTVADGDVSRLSESHKVHADALEVLAVRVDGHGKDIGALKNWRSWITGIGTTFVFLAGLGAKAVTDDMRDARIERQASAQVNVLQTEKLSDLRERVQRLEAARP